jgi:hypothetical protein
MDDDQKCIKCSKASHTPSRMSRLRLAEGIYILVMSSRAEVPEEVHRATAEFLGMVGENLCESLLKENAAKKALESIQPLHG